MTQIRTGLHDGFDRVVFEVEGTGAPGWDVRYVDEAAGQGSVVSIPRGTPSSRSRSPASATDGDRDRGVRRFRPCLGAGTEVVTEVDSTFEGTSVAFVGLPRSCPSASTCWRTRLAWCSTSSTGPEARRRPTRPAPRRRVMAAARWQPPGARQAFDHLDEHGRPRGPVRRQAPAGDRDGHVRGPWLVPRPRTAVPTPRRVVAGPRPRSGGRRRASRCRRRGTVDARSARSRPAAVGSKSGAPSSSSTAPNCSKAAAGFDGPHAQVCLTGAFDGGAPHRRVGHGSHRPTGSPPSPASTSSAARAAGRLGGDGLELRPAGHAHHDRRVEADQRPAGLIDADDDVAGQEQAQAWLDAEPLVRERRVHAPGSPGTRRPPAWP